jgi:geranylgeranyl diphosphate synthase type II
MCCHIPSITSVLSPYQKRVEVAIQEAIQNFGPQNQLRDACAYALLNGGKRFRPAIVYIVAESLGNQMDVTPAALAVEFFHTASLVADDLPCMDDDAERRSKPTVHKVYGETTALLVTYALIAGGYGLLAENAKLTKNKQNGDLLCSLALENAACNTGLLGATGGQYLDIDPPNLSFEVLRDVIHKKTVSLFEISFVFGWLFGGGNVLKLPDVKKLASHFGMAFQIADDLEDRDQDKKNGRLINLANVLGEEKAKKLLAGEVKDFLDLLHAMNLQIPAFQKMVKSLGSAL